MVPDSRSQRQRQAKKRHGHQADRLIGPDEGATMTDMKHARRNRKPIPEPTAEPPLRLRLLLAAERAVAQRGFAGASVREIQRMANTRNTSAINYHYGSLEQLLAAVFDFRASMLSKADTETAPDSEADVRTIVASMVTGLARHLEPREEGNYYLRFLERAVIEVRISRNIVPAKVLDIWHGAEAMLRKAIGEQLPAELREVRIAFALCQFISALALIEAWIESEPERAVHLPMLTQATIDSAVAILAAPVSQSMANAPTPVRTSEKSTWRIFE